MPLQCKSHWRLLRRFLLPLAALAGSPAVADGICANRAMPTLAALELSQDEHGQRQPHDVTVQHWMGLTRISGLSISPDGNWVAFVVFKADREANGHRTALIVAPTSGQGPIHNFGSVGPVVFSAAYYPVTIKPQWSPDSGRISYVMPDKDGVDQVFVWRRSDGAPNQLTHLGRDALHAIWTSNEQLLVSVLGDDSEQKRMKEELFDKGIAYFEEHSFDERYIGLSPAMSHQSYDVLTQMLCHTRLVREPFTGKSLLDRGYEVFFVSARNRKTRVASEQEAKQYEDQAGKEKARIPSVMKRHPRPHESQSATNDDKSWFKIAGETVAFEIRYELRSGQHFSGLRYLMETKKEGSQRRLSPDPQGYYTNCVYSEAADRFACLKETTETPPEVVTFKRGDNDETVLIDLNPQTRGWSTAKVETLTWKDPSGAEVFGLLYTSRSRAPGERLPLIVLPYYGASKDFIETNVANLFNIQVLVGEGFAVLRPNTIRYSTINTAGPTAKLRMMRSTHGVIMTGIEKVVAMGVGDQERLGVAGLSQGAKYASYAISHSDRFDAAIVQATVVSPLQSAGAAYASPQWAQDMNNHDDDGNIITGPERYEHEERMVTDWANKVAAPLLVTTTDGEWVWSIEAALALHNRGKPVDMIVYPDGRHFKRWPRQNASAQQQNIDWFRFWLQGYEDPDPEKEAQYTRWRTMRDEQCVQLEDRDNAASYCENTWQPNLF